MSKLIIYSYEDCGSCAAAKARLKAAGLHFKEIDLRKDERRKAVLMMMGHRSLPIFSLPAERGEDITTDLDEALSKLKRLCEAELRECENFFSPASDHFEERMNTRQKWRLEEQLAAIDKLLR